MAGRPLSRPSCNKAIYFSRISHSSHVRESTVLEVLTGFLDATDFLDLARQPTVSGTDVTIHPDDV
jgi:hypothetical protein